MHGLKQQICSRDLTETSSQGTAGTESPLSAFRECMALTPGIWVSGYNRDCVCCTETVGHMAVPALGHQEGYQGFPWQLRGCNMRQPFECNCLEDSGSNMEQAGGLKGQTLPQLGFLLLRWNTHDRKASWRGQGFWLMLPYCSSSPREVKTRTQAEQETGGRNCCKGRGRVLLIGLFPMTLSFGIN